MRMHQISVPRAVGDHLRRGVTKIIVLPRTVRLCAIARGHVVELNSKIGFTVQDVRPYASIEEAFGTERPDHYLHGSKRDQAMRFFKERVGKNAPPAVLVLQVLP